VRRAILIPDDPMRTALQSIHVYEVRPHKDHRGVDLISDGNVIETHEHKGDFKEP